VKRRQKEKERGIERDFKSQTMTWSYSGENG